MAGFAIKVPLFPLHTWLPLAHTQAPAAGSVLLAGILLKMGCYGFLRFNLPMLPAAAAVCLPWLLWLSVIGIVYGAMLALAQKDMKRLVACSSVSHMGFVMLGIFAINAVGMQGGVLQMINHGISTGALFALIGMIYDRYHTRQIADLGGLAKRLPRLSLFMLFFTFSSIGLPGLNGFAGEFMILVGMFQPRLVAIAPRFEMATGRDRRDGRVGRRAGGVVHALARAPRVLRAVEGAGGAWVARSAGAWLRRACTPCRI